MTKKNPKCGRCDDRGYYLSGDPCRCPKGQEYRKEAEQYHKDLESLAPPRPKYILKTKRNPLGKGAYPFARKEEQYAEYTDAQLAFAVKDALAARDAMKGHDPEAEGWYADDASTIRSEMNKRKAKKNPSRRRGPTRSRRSARPLSPPVVLVKQSSTGSAVIWRHPRGHWLGALHTGKKFWGVGEADIKFQANAHLGLSPNDAGGWTATTLKQVKKNPIKRASPKGSFYKGTRTGTVSEETLKKLAAEIDKSAWRYQKDVGAYPNSGKLRKKKYPGEKRGGFPVSDRVADAHFAAIQYVREKGIPTKSGWGKKLIKKLFKEWLVAHKYENNRLAKHLLAKA